MDGFSPILLTSLFIHNSKVTGASHTGQKQALRPDPAMLTKMHHLPTFDLHPFHIHVPIQMLLSYLHQLLPPAVRLKYRPPFVRKRCPSSSDQIFASHLKADPNYHALLINSYEQDHRLVYWRHDRINVQLSQALSNFHLLSQNTIHLGQVCSDTCYYR